MEAQESVDLKVGDARVVQVEVNGRIRQTGGGRCFRVGCRLVVAYEAIDIFGIAEIVVGVPVVVASMTLRTATFVRRDSDTEIVQDIVLAVDFVFKALDIRCHAFPFEVSCFEDFIGQLAVAIQAGLCAFVRMLQEIALVQLVVCVGTTGVRIAVVNIDNAIAINIFIGITNTIVVQVPAGLSSGAVGTIGTIGAVSSGGTIAAFASGQSQTESKSEQEKGVSKNSMPCGHW